MGTASLDGGVNIAGMGFPIHISTDDEGSIHQEVIVPMAYAADTTTGETTKAGTITCDDTPSITDADWVDIYWDGGVLYNADVSDVTGEVVTILDTQGLGDNLPDNGTPCIIAVSKDITTAFLGTDVSALAAYCNPSRCHIAYCDGARAAATEHLAVDIEAGEGWFWIEGLGFLNPITGNPIDHIFVSTTNIAADQTFHVGVQYDSV